MWSSIFSKGCIPPKYGDYDKKLYLIELRPEMNDSSRSDAFLRRKK